MPVEGISGFYRSTKMYFRHKDAFREKIELRRKSLAATPNDSRTLTHAQISNPYHFDRLGLGRVRLSGIGWIIAASNAAAIRDDPGWFRRIVSDPQRGLAGRACPAAGGAAGNIAD